jgi:hypothetical protein
MGEEVIGLLLLCVVVGAMVVVAATTLNRRKPEPPTQTTWLVPQQLNRAEFAGSNHPWLVALFTSETCDSCASMVSKVEVLRSSSVAVDVVSYQADFERHKRYNIDAVPTTVIADPEGIVVKSFVGPASAADLWAAVAELREPGSTPPPEAHVQRENPSH